MIKVLLPIGVVVAIVVIFVGGRLFLSSRSLSSPSAVTNVLTQTATAPKTATTSATLDQRIAELEFSVSDLLKQIKGLTPSSSTQVSGNLEVRVKTLETSMADLVNRVTALEQKGTTTTSSTTTITSKAPSYIPLGWSGSSNSTNWTSISGQEFIINTSDYPGYTSMQFEVSLRIFQNGQSFARLEDKDAGTSILSSEVSTTSQSYTWVTSSSFQLPAGSKTYRLQLKSLTGYSADVQNARIKVNF